jgi:hypothetical protein
MLTPKQCLTPVSVSGMDKIQQLMWSNDDKEFTDYCKWSLDPCDCEQRVLVQGNRCVYMTWKALDQTSIKNVNIVASRILLENNMLDPPTIENVQSDLLNYTHIFPSDHVVFHQTIDDQIVSYSRDKLTQDWEHMFSRSLPAYRKLAGERYHHYSQALMEFENTGTMNKFVISIITYYLGKQVGPVGHWNQAQLAILGAAMLLLYTRDWNLASELPRFTSCLR